MADNVAITPGTGATVAADDIGGVLHQRVKLSIGADGSAADLAPGSAAAASSLPVTASTEDIARTGAVAETAPASDTASSGLNGRLQRIAQRLTSLIALIPASLGSKADSASLAVTKSTEDKALTGALTETAPASDTASSGLNGRLQRIAQRLTSLIALVPASLGAKTSSASFAVVLASDQATVPVGQVTQGYDVAVTVTRPANTTAYTAVDVVGGAITFASMGPNAASIMVTGAQLELDIAAIPSGMTTFRLYLYSVTPPSASADNAAFDLPSGDRASFLGYIDMGTPVDLGSTCYIEASNINKQIKLAGTSLFAYLVTAGGYTPAANSEVYKLTLHAVAA